MVGYGPEREREKGKTLIRACRVTLKRGLPAVLDQPENGRATPVLEKAPLNSTGNGESEGKPSLCILSSVPGDSTMNTPAVSSVMLRGNPLFKRELFWCITAPVSK